MTARDYLDEIDKKRAKIDTLRKEINDLRESINLLPGVSYDGVKVQTSTTDVQVLATVETLVDKERRLSGLIEEWQRDRTARIQTIHLLADKDQISVLYARYVSGLYWWEIMRDMKASESTIHRIHRAALEELQTIIDKEVNA